MHTLNDIIPPSRRKEALQQNKTTNPEPLNFSSERPRKFPYITLGIVALAIFVSVGTLLYFSVARVEIIPKTVSASVQNSFTASKSGGALPFEIITAQKTASQSVKNDGTKTANSFASGTITIYNTQSKQQRIVTNTRFATSAGLIFRIRSAVTIPGGSAAKPGSVTTKVYADQPGSSYNVSPTSFTIPGFAGTPQASEVYARSSGAMTGGASGIVPVVDPVLEEQTRGALKTALAADLISNIQSQVPDGYLLLQGAATTTYEELATVLSSTTGMADVKEQGTIMAVIFPNTALANAIASSIESLAGGGQLALVSADKLSLSASNMPDIDAETFQFTIAGTAPLVYTIDKNRIAAAVVGKTRTAAAVAVSNYPEVKRAIIVLRPLWRQTFPQDPSSVSVVITDQ